MTVLIYSRPNCAYCTKAKTLLRNKNITYTENVIGEDILMEDFKATFPDQKTVPLIFIDGNKIGGYDQLVEHLKSEDGKTLLQG